MVEIFDWEKKGKHPNFTTHWNGITEAANALSSTLG
jgi:hypothetical protein